MKPKLNLPGLAFVALVASQVLLDSPCLRAASVDPNDGKSTLIDNSKGKEVPVEKSWCETPSLWEVRVGLPAWLAKAE